MNREQKAERARALLNDALLQEAFSQIRKRQLSAFENSAPESPEAREQAYTMLRALTQLESELQRAVTDHEIEVRKRAND